VKIILKNEIMQDNNFIKINSIIFIYKKKELKAKVKEKFQLYLKYINLFKMLCVDISLQMSKHNDN